MAQGAISIVKGIRYFTVSLNDFRGSLLFYFLKDLHTFKPVYDYKSRRVVQKLDKRWYIHNPYTKNYRLPISIWDKFIKYLYTQVRRDSVYIKQRSDHRYQKIEIPFNTDITPYDYQIDYIDYLVNTHTPNRLIQIQMGKGKTVIGAKAISELGYKTAIVIQPKYIDKWVGDIQELLNLTTDELLVVKGGDGVRRLIKGAKDNTNKFKIVIISNKTIQFYINNHIGGKSDTYGCTPDKFTDLLNIGTILVDEVHEHFHITYSMLLYFNNLVFIGLTATLVNNNSNIEDKYNLLFPMDDRAKDLKVHGYLNIYEIGFKLDRPNYIKTDGIIGYSSAMYEQSIMKHTKTLSNYLKMIYKYFKDGYENHSEKGDKVIIYCYTVNMCTIVSKYIQKHTDLKVSRYVSEDDYTVIGESDVIVSTILSGGTGLDIKGLITVINTISVDSITVNRQVPGRLRETKGKDLRYYYIYSINVVKHIQYTVHRRKVIKNLGKRFFTDIYNTHV